MFILSTTPGETLYLALVCLVGVWMICTLWKPR